MKDTGYAVILLPMSIPTTSTLAHGHGVATLSGSTVLDVWFPSPALGALTGTPDAALVSLSGRVRVREGGMRTSEEIVTEIWQDVFGRVEGDPGEGKAGAPTSRGTTSL